METITRSETRKQTAEAKEIYNHLNEERSHKRQGHAPSKYFVGFPVQCWKARTTIA